MMIADDMFPLDDVSCGENEEEIETGVGELKGQLSSSLFYDTPHLTFTWRVPCRDVRFVSGEVIVVHQIGNAAFRLGMGEYQSAADLVENRVVGTAATMGCL